MVAQRSGATFLYESQLVKRALAVCRDADSAVTLSSITRDDAGNTRLRLRAGDDTSFWRLQTLLRTVLPFCETEVHESLIDGVLEANVALKTRAQMWRAARANVSHRFVFKLWRYLCMVLGLSGFGALVARHCGH